MSVPKIKIKLAESVSPTDKAREYVVELPDVDDRIPTESDSCVMIKLLTFDDSITLSFEKRNLNRILTMDFPSKFCAVSFANFKLGKSSSDSTADYIERFLINGLMLNGSLYTCFGWSNSQLKSRSCLLYSFRPNTSAAQILKTLGNFDDILTVGKKAKRIGLLFTETELGLKLPESRYLDIPDIERDGHIFTDGCGFMSMRFAKHIAKSRSLVFHAVRYVPSVVQIRYRGYKGVLVVNSSIKKDVYFRKSMRKFTGSRDDTFAVNAYSKPYTFGKLNAELVTLLSVLGIQDEVFLQKQRQYFDMISEAADDSLKAFVFLSYMGYQEAAESVVLNGLQSAKKELKEAQQTAWGKMFDKRDSEKVHILVPESRILFGVADSTETLRPNECHVRITVEGMGVRSLHGAWVIVGRNPCLHPGDIRKLKVRELPELRGVVDCIVFSVNGKTPPPSMMSGGDLDGDQFFVSWDKDLIPSVLSEPYHYPPAKEKPKHSISHDDLVRYFARYNNASLGRVKNLYLDWVRAKGAACQECQELNHLFSCCVDGERIRIPDKLLKPPPATETFVLEKLTQQVTERGRTIRFGHIEENLSIDIVEFLASATDICLDEYELFQLVHRWCVKNEVNIKRFIDHFDFSSFTSEQRRWVSQTIEGLDDLLRNALLQSLILTKPDINQYGLGRRDLHWRRLYSSEIDGSSLFLPQLTVALEDFTRKLLVIDANERVKIALLIAKPLSEAGEIVIDTSVTAFAFRPRNTTSGRRMTTHEGYRLAWDGNIFQLFNNARGNTFVFLRRAETASHGELGIMSVALGRFGAQLETNIGRLYREPLRGIEIYVISNRDRVGHNILDISDNNVPTEAVIERIQNVPLEYELKDIQSVDWALYPPLVHEVIFRSDWTCLATASENDIVELESLLCKYQDLPGLARLATWYSNISPNRLPKLLTRAPRLCILIDFPFNVDYVIAIIKSANYAGQFALSVLTKNLPDATLGFDDIARLISLVPIAVRSPHVALELITALHAHVKSQEHLATLVRNVAIDRFAEAAEVCECDDWGIPRAEESECMLACLEVKDDKVKGHYRLDLKTSFRVGDHVRLRSAGTPKNAPFYRPRVLDAQVIAAESGVLTLKLIEPLPIENCSWYVLPSGNTTTTNAMTAAIRKLAKDKTKSCAFYEALIPSTGRPSGLDDSRPAIGDIDSERSGLNTSQRRAVIEACRSDITLVWGPPGTGKTTTIVQIIKKWEKEISKGVVLVAASTNNAVDNVLEKYISQSTDFSLVRVSQNSSDLSKTAQRYWVGAFVEGDINRSKEAMKKAQKKISEAKLIFTTCTGAVLGLLKRTDFAYVIVDEASQLTEPNCLIPLVKNCQKVVLVGDHVQLRPNVTQLGAAYGYDVSLFERLYLQQNSASKIMLNVQYRMHPDIVRFPSERFYDGKLASGVSAMDRQLNESAFNWRGTVMFVDVPAMPEGQESFSRRDGSKSNPEQAKKCKEIVASLQQLKSPTSGKPPSQKISVAVLTPYTAQLKLLQSLSKSVESPTVSSVTVATIDSFQGREADVVVFCTVRCNQYCSIGFLSDERRMNVALTRAKRGLIVVGNKQTLLGSAEGGAFWKAWFASNRKSGSA